MAKRTDLLREIRQVAEAHGTELRFIRHGARHDIWRVGRVQFSMPRHRELGERLAQAIRHELESELGEEWWR